MPNSYVSNHIHIVFATKTRARIIPDDLQPKLWSYLAGIAKNHGMDAIAIGGTDDHVHALINLGAILGISKAVQTLKANSSRWINEHRRTRFDWQEGYFACSVSRSQIPSVSRYIANQKAHHAKIDSAAEFLLLLKKHGFDPPADVTS
jgi:putative transposase